MCRYVKILQKIEGKYVNWNYLQYLVFNLESDPYFSWNGCSVLIMVLIQPWRIEH